jgi:hypothetical protein
MSTQTIEWRRRRVAEIDTRHRNVVVEEAKIGRREAVHCTRPEIQSHVPTEKAIA